MSRAERSSALPHWIFAAAVVGLVAAGCGGSSTGNSDARRDVAPDRGDVRDGGADRGDVGGNAGTGGSGGGAGNDGGPDGGPDGGNDGGNDVAPDAPVNTTDALPDVGVDRPDATADTRPDATADVTMDRPVDQTPDRAVDRFTCTTGESCRRAGGGAGLCQNNMCVACVDTTDDARCVTAYGAAHICVAGACVAGTCHDSAGCAAGQLCGVPMANRCGICANDGQCKGDARYGANFICNTTTGQADSGKCVAAACTAASTTCAANSSDFCCGGRCVAGNCCNDDDCRNNPAFGQFFACSANSCSQCAGAVGNQYLVDPIGGNDATATGSGKIGTTALASCSFKTITRALQVIGNDPPVGTTITVVGSSSAPTRLYTIAEGASAPEPETLPIRIPGNVKITTSGGPIAVVIPPAVAGAPASTFVLSGAGAAILPLATARLSIDGSLNTVAGAIVSRPGAANSAAIGNVSIATTADDSISVVNGTLNIGPGVIVRAAGRPTTLGRRSGLHVSGGTARIVVPAGQAQTSFNGNTGNGITVENLGTLIITGVSTGGGTVVANQNALSNIFINHTPGMAPAVSVIDGVVASNNASISGAGIHILGGSRVKLRNSITLANAGSGVLITAADATPDGSALAGIDLGTGAADFGHNVLAAGPGFDPNLRAGLCVTLATGAGAQTLNATGNVFIDGRDCSMANPGATAKATTCVGISDEAVEPAAGTTVTIVRTNCL